MTQEFKPLTLQELKHYEKLKRYRKNARGAIKDLIKHNELLRAVWLKEMNLTMQLRTEKTEAQKTLFRFAKWVYPKFFPESPNAPGTFAYTAEVSKWLHKWEREIDERPKETK